MRILHIVPGTSDISNGMAVVARLIAKEQKDASVLDLNSGLNEIVRPDVEDVWVHGMWLPKEWAVCRNVLKSGKRLVRMTHGSLSPIYLKHQSPIKKWLVGPIERHFLRKADRVVATCEAEADWIRDYEPCIKSIEVNDLKRFFMIDHTGETGHASFHSRPLHLLYLGRNHALKGISYLEEAWNKYYNKCFGELRIVYNAFGDELERIWDWCDALILPTLSENFGLVIAEALERGKRVITTDGAPAWGDGNTYGGRLIYLKGYLNGSREERVAILEDAMRRLYKEWRDECVSG